MRGAESTQEQLFSLVGLEQRIPAEHPIRAFKALVEPILRELSPAFDALYADSGRPSIPPEQLLRALLLQVLYTVRSERQLMEQLDFNLLFRWFVGLQIDDPIWHPTVFTKNRDRLLDGDIAGAFMAGVLRAADSRRLLSHEHFTVDGTQLEAWASQKSFRRKDQPVRPGGADDDPGNPSIDFHHEKRSNATHASTSDPDARLTRKGKGKEAKLGYHASVAMDNRHGLVVGTVVGHADGGLTEMDQGLALMTAIEAEQPGRHGRRTMGGDKGYAKGAFIDGARSLGFTPHVAQEDHDRVKVLDQRTTRHPGYTVSQRRRKRVEECFGWSKTIGGLRKLRHRGRETVDWVFTFTLAAYNLVRIRTLIRVGVCPT